MSKIKLFSGDNYIRLEEEINEFLESEVELMNIEFSTTCKDNSFKDVIYSVIVQYAED